LGLPSTAKPAVPKSPHRPVILGPDFRRGDDNAVTAAHAAKTLLFPRKRESRIWTSVEAGVADSRDDPLLNTGQLKLFNENRGRP
jgi:hypothetical protein